MANLQHGPSRETHYASSIIFINYSQLWLSRVARGDSVTLRSHPSKLLSQPLSSVCFGNAYYSTLTVVCLSVTALVA